MLFQILLPLSRHMSSTVRISYPGEEMRRFIVASLIVSMGSPLLAQNTIHYAYDARGRLIKAYTETGQNAGHINRYSYDRAENRQSVVNNNVMLTLQVNEFIQSPDGRFKLVMQGDGNLVLYFGSQALWVAPGTWGTTNRAAFQNDGNFVVYGPSGALWSAGLQSPGGELFLQNDGNLVIYSINGTPVWATGTGGH